MAHNVKIGASASFGRDAAQSKRTGLRPELAAFFALKRGKQPSLRANQHGILAKLAAQRCTD